MIIAGKEYEKSKKVGVLSVIIPTLNESEYIGRLLERLIANSDPNKLEIIVVDGGSNDDTCRVVSEYSVTLIRCKPNRARQMNAGAWASEGSVIYFVHGDSLPPETYFKDISVAINEGFDMGSYRAQFDGGPGLLHINSFFTRFDRLWCRGGDQSLFATRTSFEDLNGFREDLVVMEEYDFLQRARKHYKFRILSKEIMVSARKYRDNGYFKVQLANLIAFRMYLKGCDSNKILDTYRNRLQYRN